MRTGLLPSPRLAWGSIIGASMWWVQAVCTVGVLSQGARRHLPSLGSRQGLHSYSLFSITDHSPHNSAAHRPSQQPHNRDRPCGSRHFRHTKHHSLDPFQEEVLRAKFRGKAGAHGLVWGLGRWIPANPCPSLTLIFIFNFPFPWCKFQFIFETLNWPQLTWRLWSLWTIPFNTKYSLWLKYKWLLT